MFSIYLNFFQGIYFTYILGIFDYWIAAHVVDLVNLSLRSLPIEFGVLKPI